MRLFLKMRELFYGFFIGQRVLLLLRSLQDVVQIVHGADELDADMMSFRSL